MAIKDFSEAIRLDSQNTIARYWIETLQERKKLGVLSIMQGKLAKLIASSLSDKLCMNVHVSVASLDELTYENYILSFSRPTTLATISMEQLKGNAILEINPEASIILIDRLFGGTGERTKYHDNLTGIERSSMKGVIIDILEDIHEAWSQIIDLRPRLVRIDNGLKFAQIALPSDTVILVALEIKLGNTEGMISLCLPYATIDPLIHMLPVTCLEAVKKDGRAFEYVPEYLKTTEMCLVAVMWDGELLEYVPEHLKTVEICLEAVKKSGFALEYVPEHLKTLKLCLEAVKKDGWGFEYVPEKFKPEKGKALKEIEDIKIEVQTLLNLKKQNNTLPEGKMLYLQELLDRREMLVEFLKENEEETTEKPNGTSLQDVPEELRTSESYLEALKKNGWLLWYVPKKHRTMEICLAAIKGSGLVFSEMLEISRGNQKAIDAIDRLIMSLQKQPFGFIRNTGLVRLLVFLRREHPQIIAFILAHIESKKAAYILQNLSSCVQGDVIHRIATINPICLESLYEFERILENKFPISSIENMLGKDDANTVEMENIVRILDLANLASEKMILKTLEHEESELAEDIKNRIFFFEDVVLFSDRDILELLTKVDAPELSKALKGAKTKIHSKFFRNMSKRASKMLKEDMERMGSIPIRDIEESQQKIVSLVYQLENSGKIVIDRYSKAEQISARKLTPCNKNNTPIDGMKAASEILKLVDRTTEAQVIKKLENADPDLAKGIKTYLQAPLKRHPLAGRQPSSTPN